jgi:hypothetical protein
MFIVGLVTHRHLRVCPGRYIADRSGFHVAASTAALYDIAPLEGRTRPDPKSVKYTDTAFRRVDRLIVIE